MALHAAVTPPPSKIACGEFHTLALSPFGTVFSTGPTNSAWPNYGQCDVGDWYDVTAIAAGAVHSAALRSDGTVVAVGDNYNGQCNVSNWTGIAAIFAGGWVTLGLRSNGTVIATGSSNLGQLNVSSWNNIVSLATGGEHTLGLKADGTVLATGTNGWGQCNVSGWSNIVAIAAGAAHSVGLRADGTLISIGFYWQGQTNVTGISNVIAVAAGDYTTLALKANHTVTAVGENGSGQCDVGAWTNITGVAGGLYHTVAVKADNTLVAVGANDYQQSDVWAWYLSIAPVPPIITRPPVREVALVGSPARFEVTAASWPAIRYIWRKNGTPVGTNAPSLSFPAVQASDAAEYSVIVSNVYGATTSAPVRLDVISPPAQRHPSIAAGAMHTLGLRADGKLLATGNNTYGTGQINVGGWNNIVAIAAGYAHSVGLREDGSVLAVGWTNNAQCSVTDWRNIVGIGASIITTMGLKADGGAVVASSDFIRSDVADWTNLIAVAAGEFHSLGLRRDGTVVAVGRCDGGYGTLGPCYVGAWSNITAIAAGYFHAVGLQMDGRVIAAGTNQYGECNVSSWSNIVAIACGSFHTVGLRNDGTVLATGTNYYGECNVSGWTGIVAIAAGQYRTVGLRVDDTVIATGNNLYSANDVATWYLGTNLVPPIFTVPPTNQVGYIGRSITFNTVAASPSANSYQWQKNGTNFGSASATLTLTGLTWDDAGDYSVVARNSYGATTSSVARLTIELPPANIVGPLGTGLLHFETRPSVDEWATRSIIGGASTFTTPAMMDSAITALDTSSITNQLAETLTVPPSVGALARWNSAGHYLQTRPAGVACTLLLGSFRNDTGQTLDTIHLSYSLVVTQFIDEVVAGHRVFFSLSGAPGTWQVIPELTGKTNTPLESLINVGNWLPSTRLYLLWADDDGFGTDTGLAITGLALRPGTPLRIQPMAQGRSELTWLLGATNYVVESSTNLQTGPWQPVPEQALTNATTHSVLVTNSAPTRFFRLRRVN